VVEFPQLRIAEIRGLPPAIGTEVEIFFDFLAILIE
jgi:hypothetical protein